MKKFKLKNSIFVLAKTKINSVTRHSISSLIYDDITSSVVQDVRVVIWDSIEPLNNTDVWHSIKFNIQTKFEKK